MRMGTEFNAENKEKNIGAFVKRLPRTDSVSLETGSADSGLGAQMMKMAELNPQYEADKAATDVQNKGDAQLGAENRRLRAMGIDPSSGRSRSRNRNLGIAMAAAKAGAANKARRGALMDNWQRMSAAITQSGRDQANRRASSERLASYNAAGNTPLVYGGSSSGGSFGRAKARAKASGSKSLGAWRKSRKGGRKSMYKDFGVSKGFGQSDRMDKVNKEMSARVQASHKAFGDKNKANLATWKDLSPSKKRSARGFNRSGHTINRGRSTTQENADNFWGTRGNKKKNYVELVNHDNTTKDGVNTFYGLGSSLASTSNIFINP